MRAHGLILVGHSTLTKNVLILGAHGALCVHVGPGAMLGAMSESSVAVSTVQGVRTWLNTQGYPLEMRSVGTFQSYGAFAQQSTYYISPEGKAREIDVHAQFSNTWTVVSPQRGSSHTFTLSAVCECKSGASAKKPWVVFSSRTILNELRTFRMMRIGNVLGPRLLLHVCDRPEVEALELFKAPQRYGHSLVVAHTDATKPAPRETFDPGFGTLAKIAEAAKANGKAQGPGLPGMPFNCLVIPVIIVGSPLVECWLDEMGAIQIEERERASVAFTHPDVGSSVIVDVVRETALPAYARDMKVAFDTLEGIYRGMGEMLSPDSLIFDKILNPDGKLFAKE